MYPLPFNVTHADKLAVLVFCHIVLFSVDFYLDVFNIFKEVDLLVFHKL